MAYENTDDVSLCSDDDAVNVFVKCTDTVAFYSCDIDGMSVIGKSGFVEVNTAASTLTKTEVRTVGPHYTDFCYLTPQKPANGTTRFLCVEKAAAGEGPPNNQMYLRVVEVDPINKTIADHPRSDSLFSSGSLPDDEPTKYTDRPCTTVCTSNNAGYVIIVVLDDTPDPVQWVWYLISWTVTGNSVSIGSPSEIERVDAVAGDPPDQYCVPVNAAPLGGGSTVQFWIDIDKANNERTLYRDEGGSSSAGSCNTAVGDTFADGSSYGTSINNNVFQNNWHSSILDGDNPIVLAVGEKDGGSDGNVIVAIQGVSAGIALETDDTIPYSGDDAARICTFAMGPAKFAFAHESSGDVYFSECRINKNFGITFSVNGFINIGGTYPEAVIPVNEYQSALIMGLDSASNVVKAWLIVGLSGYDGSPPAGDTDLYAGQGSLSFRSTLPFDQVAPGGIDLKEPDSTLVVGSLDGADEFVVYAETPYTSVTANPDGVDTPTSHPATSLKWL